MIETFKIHGMDCADEIAALRREVGPLVGGEDHLSFDLLNGRMTVTSEKVNKATVIEAVRRTGMTAAPADDEQSGATGDASSRTRRRLRLLTMFSGGGTLVGFVLHAVLGGGVWAAIGSEGAGAIYAVPFLAVLVYIAAIVAGVWHFVPKALIAVRRLRPDMNLLMVTAVAGAVYLNEWLEAATVSFLFTLSVALESWSIGRARRAVAALLDLTPTTVAVLQADGSERPIRAEAVPVGARFIVRPGERIPLDGRVLKGTSDVNQAPLTGESIPATKEPDDQVYAGTVNGSATLEIESTKPAGETTLAHIIRLVGEAQSKRSPSEQWVESFARYYTPIVMGSALLVLFIGPLFSGDELTTWLYRALVLLVIACPCALVISTPVSIVAALAGATRRGVLIKGGPFVEAPARLRAIAFDKTGTLTVGRPAVVRVVPLHGHDLRELLDVAAALEVRSTHPLAIAVTEYARTQGIVPRPADQFEIVAGKGAVGTIRERSFWIGSPRYLQERGQESNEARRQIAELADAGYSVVVVGDESEVHGFITLADTIRPNAAQTITDLRATGIQRLIMLSGDNRATADAIGRQVGVDEVRAELLPADKVQAIEELVARYHNVGMIGDGINDAPALARATIGIAMGGIGSDAAIETADIALMSDDIGQLPWMVRHSRRALWVIRQNIAFSLVIKAVFVVLTLLGHASLWAAIAADMGASLLVIFNGLRLLRAEPIASTSSKPWRGRYAP